jgi:hypothetical protein
MRFIIVIAAAILFWGCGGDRESMNNSAADSIRVELMKQIDSVTKLIDANPVRYKEFATSSSAPYKNLVNEYGEEEAGLILKLNRIDQSHLKARDTIIVPDTVITNMLYYSPFPFSIRDAEYIPKLLFISQEIQAFAGYEYGVLVNWGPTSTGKPSTPTPNGLFHTNWKAEETISTSNDEWLLRWNFNIENFDGIAIHQYDMPGYPASHSCARLFEGDAVWFYNWGEQWILTPGENDVLAHGTPVIIFGDYDFDGKKPWRYLSEDPDANTYSRRQLENILSEHLETILQRQTQRDSIETRSQLSFLLSE